ncbi:hypothetical protein SAMN04488005_1491 [Yoonia tamlensis]|uniref:Uncharacterized protein n=1 Tax=Yoonia tamlensis TaxID=390270 RepID=A0A1I6GE21_9RHOB|nr:hypothetical protein [Yoonia tamlensis]SFR40390.1 hypothetical protein SAMN04488005_1491 [Yoonia tamlensis]
MRGFTKVSAGQACRVAEAFGGVWGWPEKNSTVREAIDADGCVIAYIDETGHYAHASYAKLDLSDVFA